MLPEACCCLCKVGAGRDELLVLGVHAFAHLALLVGAKHALGQSGLLVSPARCLEAFLGREELGRFFQGLWLEQRVDFS